MKSSKLRTCLSTFEHHPFALLTVITLSADLLLLRNVIFIGPFQTSDINVQPYGPGLFGLQLFSAWDFSYLGGPNGPTPYAVVGSLFTTLTNNPVLFEKLSYIPAIPASSFLAYPFLRQLGLRGLKLVGFAGGFQLSPWLIGQFLSGEPTAVWMYALLPAFLYGVLQTIDRPADVRGYVILTLSLTAASAMNFEAELVYGLFSLPFLVTTALTKSRLSTLAILFGWILGGLVSLCVNLMSIGPYLSSATRFTTQLVTKSNTSFLVGPPLTQYELPLLLLTGSLGVLLIVGPRLYVPREFVLVTASTGLVVGLDLVYFSLPSHFALVVLTKSVLLLPFVDLDKFILVGWFFVYLALALFVHRLKFGTHTTHENESNVLTKRFASRRLGISLPRRGTVEVCAVVAAVGILLLATTTFTTLSPPQYGRFGYDFFAGNESFDSAQIPESYFDLHDFVLAHGSSYGLSFHTAIFPENPGLVVPNEVGEALIPGFVWPSELLANLTAGIITNDSRSLEEAALAGVAYYAWMPSVPYQQWPSTAAGPPATAPFFGGWIPVGDASDYLRILSSWADLRVVDTGPGLVVFQNTLYRGPVEAYASFDAIMNLSGGSFGVFTNKSPIGPELLQADYTNTTVWQSNSGFNNVTLLDNETLAIGAGPGAYLRTQLDLLGGRYYEFSFNLSQSSNYTTNPSTSYATRSVMYWSWANFTPQWPQWYTPVLSGSPEAHYDYIFEMPNNSTIVHAQLDLYAAAPTGVGVEAYVRYSNLTLHEISGANMFLTDVRPALVNTVDYTEFDVSYVSSGSQAWFFTIDTSYDSGWTGLTSTGIALVPISGPFGFLTFSVPLGVSEVTVMFSGQATYESEVTVCLVVAALLVGLSSLLLLVPQYRFKLEALIRKAATHISS